MLKDKKTQHTHTHGAFKRRQNGNSALQYKSNSKRNE